MMTCLLAIFIGAFSLSIIGTNRDYLTAGVSSAEFIFDIIDRVPPIDKYSNAIVPSKPIETFKGNISFKGTVQYFASPKKN